MGWFGREGILHLCGSKQTGQPVGVRASWETGLEGEVGEAGQEAGEQRHQK